jgi:hypothetical protein
MALRDFLQAVVAVLAHHTLLVLDLAVAVAVVKLTLINHKMELQPPSILVAAVAVAQVTNRMAAARVVAAVAALF